jgi:hypothetical protein
MRKGLILLTALLTLTVGQQQTAYATSATWTNVTIIAVYPCSSQNTSCGTNGMVQVNFSANGTGGNSCGSGFPAWAIIDISNNSGLALFHVAMLARSTGAVITATGAGNCNVYAGKETLGQINY